MTKEMAANAATPALVEGRECGDCIVCCKTLEIDELAWHKNYGMD